MQRNTGDIPEHERLERLNRLFRSRLGLIAQRLYRPFIADGTVRKEEVDNEIARYYAAKKSGLQAVYSYYGEQWDYYHRVSAAHDSAFLPMLRQARSLFARLYSPTELNLTYYIERMTRLPSSHDRWQALRRHFMQKWNRLLSEREDAYQRKHIDRLCDDYFRMVDERTGMLQNRGHMGSTMAPRLAWLQITQSPEMRVMMKKLTPLVCKNAVIKELNEILGRAKEDESRLYRAVAGRTPVSMLRSATHSDIVGVREGNNLSALLPVEYCFMSDKQLEYIFIRRYTESKLAVFDAVSRQTVRAEATSRRGKDVKSRVKGPFVVCVDTSGSMRGERETFAKAVVLSLALLSERLDRLCRVILFSNQIEVLELRNLYDELPLLENFLCHSFYGGSDMQEVLDEAVRTLQREDFRYADMLWISDFEMQPVSPVMAARIEELKQRDLRLYAVAVGEHYERSYLSLATRFWVQP